MVFPFVASIFDGSAAFEANYDMTQINVQYLGTVKKVLVDHREVQCVQKELSRLWSETGKIKLAFQKVFAKYCRSGLYNLKFGLLDHLVKDVERFEIISFTGAAPLDHFYVLIMRSYRMTS